MRTLYTYITILLLVASCGPQESETCHKRITFYNNYHKDTYIRSNGVYPDTMYAIKHPPAIVSQAHMYKTPSGQSNGDAIVQYKGCVEHFFRADYGNVFCIRR